MCKIFVQGNAKLVLISFALIVRIDIGLGGETDGLEVAVDVAVSVDGEEEGSPGRTA